MVSIRGSPPDLLDPPPGCKFHPRCSYVMNVCNKEEPRLQGVSGEHHVACHLVKKT
jgi:peptide/nickel transport system ATP-binding protein